MKPLDFRAVARSHIVLGVPLAAFLHSVVQFANEAQLGLRDVLLFPVHFLAGVVVGSVILAPAFFGQALLFQLLTTLRVPTWLVIALCAGYQAGVVALWGKAVGIEPSLAGRFALTPPMIVAGFVAGGVVAWRTTVVAGRCSN